MKPFGSGADVAVKVPDEGAVVGPADPAPNRARRSRRWEDMRDDVEPKEEPG